MEETTQTVQAVISWFAEQGLEYASNVVEAVIILFIGFWIAARIKNWVQKLLGNIDHIDGTLRPVAANVARYGVLIITLIAVLNQFGVQTASIIAVLGAAGLAIGLALQGTLQNIAAGIMLLFLRPFKVGEFVEAGSVTGTVEEIGLFATRFTTLDGVYVISPNSSLASSKVVNYSRAKTRRIDTVVGISYDDDIDKAIEILTNLMTSDARALKDPSPACYVTNLGDSAVDITARCWCDPADFWAFKTDLTKKAKVSIEAAGLSIPYPQSDVHLLKKD